MNRRLTGLALGAALLLAGGALAQQTAAPKGYLAPAAWPDAVALLPPPPARGSSQEAGDQAVFKATRPLKGSARWALAQADVSSQPAAMLKNFSCAAGTDLSPQANPRLTALLGRVGTDLNRQVSSVKAVFKRPRPYLIDDGPICVAKSVELAASPDYPSGHATWGWGVGLILAELAPDRAGPILSRARAYGESRVVCGVHSPSAVAAGQVNAAMMLAALHGDAQFRADLEAARTELATVRKAGAAPDACGLEARLTAKAPY